MPFDPQITDVPSDQPIRIFLVDDQLIVRRGLAMLFSTEPDLLVCGGAGRAAEAMLKIVPAQPDLVVVDLVLEEGDAFDLITALRRKLPALKILVFSTHREPSFVVRAMRAGADDYIPKDESPQNIIQAIRELTRELVRETVPKRYEELPIPVVAGDVR